MKSFLIGVALCTACSVTEFHRTPVSVEQARKTPQPYTGNDVKQDSIEAMPGSVSPVMPKAPTVPAVPMAPASHADEVIQPPAKVSGSFLSCQHLIKPSTQFAYIGCHFQNEAGARIEVLPESVAITATATSFPASSYKLRLATSGQSKLSAWIDIESTDGRANDITRDLRISVTNLNPFQSISEDNRPLSELLNPVFANTSPDWQRVCDPNGSCMALNNGTGIFWSDVLTIAETYTGGVDWCAAKAIAGLRWRLPSINEVRISNDHNITETAFSAELNQSVLGRVWGTSVMGTFHLVEAEGPFAFFAPGANTVTARVICVAQ